MRYEQSTLYKTAFSSKDEDESAELRSTLQASLLKMRERTQALVGEIAADLRSFTVHDIDHLDALWGTASEIAGPAYALNPLEAFILGGAILIHDAGMCSAAYPGGLEEIKKDPRWPIYVDRHASLDSRPEDIVSLALADFLRSEHASRAVELPKIEWKSPDGAGHYLIEDSNLRQKLSKFIGEIAASHWWSHDQVAERINKIIPAPPPFPIKWKIDLLKLAALLRVADAAQLDERRAPGFLWALRAHNLDKESMKHWLFQNRLTQPERRGDAIYYGSTADFDKSESEAWWLAFDTLRMVDSELKRTDTLIATYRDDSVRFAAKRVSHSDSVYTFSQNITVRDWIPVDTSIKISRVIDLIERLGGEALYGKNPSAALREIIQNCADAIQRRLAIDSSLRLEECVIKLEISDANGRINLSVSDNGIGMSKSTLVTRLLDFGNTDWILDEEFSPLEYPRFFEAKCIGKFGIGFYSVFMISDALKVLTRRFDQSYDSTLLLEFSDGLRQRPVLSFAERQSRRPSGGTQISMKLKGDYWRVREDGGKGMSLHIAQLFPCLPYPIEIGCCGNLSRIIGKDWAIEPIDSLLRRLIGDEDVPAEVSKFSKHARTLINADGTCVGRAFIAPRSNLFSQGPGWLICKGVTVSRMSGIGGVLESNVITASRDVASPIVEVDVLNEWVAEQEEMLLSADLPTEIQAQAAEIIVALGAVPRHMKFCFCSSGWLDLSSLKAYAQNKSKISIVQDAAYHLAVRKHGKSNLEDSVLCVSMAQAVVFNTNKLNESSTPFDHMGGLDDLLFNTIALEWGLTDSVKNAYDQAKRVEETCEVIIATNDSGKKIRDRGLTIWRGMTVEDLKKQCLS